MGKELKLAIPEENFEGDFTFLTAGAMVIEAL
jgi:hypothetical protein